ncbi:MAG: (deoxy)nucleoside triphosphate pyrophosphohydrolase [Candidatus Saccharicenans sp.]|jgi:mutator protein MutT|nr:(deoxy)nucleoside triphosphate pyrophosphohydrolase [Candidatus Saccharicenans sp.]MDH7492783.1 (deoxy)nucleoside triphosphate pyrophosphohydrolase [Candidatus Saccharicenans sp.]
MIVVAAIIKKGRLVLLAERVGETPDGGWEFPGGKVEKGETPERALAREIQEELKVNIKVGRLLDTVNLPGQPETKLMAFEAELLSETISLTSHRGYAWARPEELLQFQLLPADRELVERLQARNYFGQISIKPGPIDS